MSDEPTSMTLFDTLSRTVRPLQPSDGRTFRFYCCGPTVYAPAHIGNFRTFVLQDVFRRTLEMSGLVTQHVRNVTDVDDKTIRDARATGKKLSEFTDFWKAKFHQDCLKLNLLLPHIEPGAVDHIPHQIRMIEELIQNGHAYLSPDGSVYYRVSSFPEYGKLSHLAEQELVLGTSAQDSDEYTKDSLADFALWKAYKPEDGENSWESPWGRGRPGWHLECSAMSREYLGDTFDLHSGGIDLCFPHHENEIAQSEATSGKLMCHHWFHITHLMVNGGKMSKSEGNFFTLSDLIEKGFTPAELRYVLIAAHYRQPLNFVAKNKAGELTFDSLRGARQALKNLARAEAALRKAAGASTAPTFEELRALGSGDSGPLQAAWQALLGDLNTPEALGQVFAGLKQIQPGQEALAWKQLHRVLWSLGLELPVEQEIDIPAEIQELAQRRWEAKKARDWPTADRLRAELTTAGWVINDAKDGYEIVPAQ